MDMSDENVIMTEWLWRQLVIASEIGMKRDG